MITALIGMVVLLGGLIFFHELGHYSVAKFFGVKVEVFSIGFGKKIFSRQYGETEYCLSLFPLGGYVKLMGDDPYQTVSAEDAERAFLNQKLYKRFLVVAAGPIANLLLAYVLFSVIFLIGQPQLASKVGMVVYQSEAWNFGLRPKDVIESVNQTPVRFWNEVDKLLRKQPLDSKVSLQVVRNQEKLNIEVPIRLVQSKSDFGEPIRVHGIPTFSAYPVGSMIGVSNPKSEAYKAGLRTGDKVTKINATKIDSWVDLEYVFNNTPQNSSLTFTISRGMLTKVKNPKTEELLFSVVYKPDLRLCTDQQAPSCPLNSMGIYAADTFVYEVSPTGPALKAGIQNMDRFVSINQVPVHHFEQIAETIQKMGPKKENMEFVIERDGQRIPLFIQPVETVLTDPLTFHAYKSYIVGFSPIIAYAQPEIAKRQIYGLEAITTAIHETHNMSYKMLLSLLKLATGSLSVKNLGGPILIATEAGKSLDAGLVPFLQMMALISINLFLLNLFPIPVLDGGHLFFYGIEAIKGKPVSIRTMEIANHVGLVMILILVVLTFFNDISRIVGH